jgi:hypothetical protein
MHRRRLAATFALGALMASSASVAAADPPIVPVEPVTVHVFAIEWGEPFAVPAPPVVPPWPWPALAQPVAEPRGGVECDDRKHSYFTDGRWQTTYSWRFRGASTPAGITKAGALRALKSAMRNITEARNDCGRADNVGVEAIYWGGTTRKPGLTASGTCHQQDRFNVVGFGRVPRGIAALTCVWSTGGRIIEADVRFDGSTRWATSAATCHLESMLEAVATHEFGHVFGLGHVSESGHGRLTMSTRLDGLCNNQESSLGLGDMLGLEKRY